MKSMQGVYDVEEKQNFHNEAFPWKMVDILRVAKPTLTIVDGLICGEGYGPIYTDPVTTNLIVSSTDVVAIDAVCSEIMGIEAHEVPITRLGHADDRVNEQVKKQLNKLIDVIKITDHTDLNTIERENILIRVNVPPSKRTEVFQLVEVCGADVIDISSKSIIVGMKGEPEEVDSLIELLHPYGIKELMRTGRLSMLKESR